MQREIGKRKYNEECPVEKKERRIEEKKGRRIRNV